MAIDAAAGITLALAALRQDAAGRGMVLLPTLLLFAFALIGYWLLRSNRLGGSLAVTAIPAVVVLAILLFTLIKDFPRKKSD